jgi:cellulose synthase/poly-beta-1,6-N-acetylglucosamine synthase-like glycosyltransferase
MRMSTLVFLLLVTLILYVLKIQKYKRNWERYPEIRSSADDALTGISVIIAFRNEASNLEALLSSLKKQVYPIDFHEIILVNDHSDDGSEAIVCNFCKTNPNFILINNEKEIIGKKSAVINGLNSASFELIVTTDADCIMGEYWLATIARFYCEKNPDMIIGLVDIISGSGFMEQFQEVEFLSLIGAGAGAAAGQRPIYCNAACFAFKKSLFWSMEDPLQQVIASGDDTLFMHAAKKNRTKSIMLLKSVKAIVVTHGLSSWYDYYNQRRRWVSKSRYYYDVDIVYTALLVLFLNLGLVFSLVVFMIGRNFWIFPALYLGKTLIDFFFLKSFLQFYDKKLPAIRFMVYALIYPFYVIFFVLAGLLSDYTWKGRRN